MNQMAREQLLDQLGCELTFNLLMLVCSPEALTNTSMTAREAQALLCFFFELQALLCWGNEDNQVIGLQRYSVLDCRWAL
jgi:hypothetical protein